MIIRDLDDDLATLNNGRMNNRFLQACRDGNLEIVKELYTKHSKTILKNKVRYAFYKLGGVDSNKLAQLDPYYYNNSPLKAAFESNHYEVVEFLLTDKLFINGYNKDNNGFRLSQGVAKAIEYCNLRVIDLVAPLIKDTPSEVYDDIQYGFNSACKTGNTASIEYILTNPKIKKVLQENEGNSFNTRNPDYFQHLKKHGFLAACQSGNLDAVEYFTKTNNPQTYLDIHSISYNTQIIVGSFEVLHYLIFDLNIDRDTYEIGHLEPSPALGDFIEINQKIKEMFDKRELFKEINSELGSIGNQAVPQSKKRPKL